VLRKDLKNQLVSWDKTHEHTDAYFIAMTYADLGDLDQAFAWLDKAIQLRSTWLFWIYTSDTPLQRDPRFADVKRKMGVS
jgi:hypothetical protein